MPWRRRLQRRPSVPTSRSRCPGCSTSSAPDVDYIPLLALLGSQLTDAAVITIAAALASESDQSSADAIRAAIKQVTAREEPSKADIARVRIRLAAGGWPLAKPDAGSWPEPAGS